MRKPVSGLLTEEDLFLFLDYYELTSGKCNLDFKMNQQITANFVFREIPKQGHAYPTKLNGEIAEWLDRQ